jgi:UDP-3-O-[3-hydroxymyristoyl] glucosamine N-acyltransferase
LTNWTLAQIAEHIHAEVLGDAQHQVSAVATLQNASVNTISFLANTKYKKFLQTTKAGAVLVDKTATELSLTVNLIVVDDPYVAYAKVAALLNPRKKGAPGIHPTAWIEPSAELADDVSIGAQVTVGANTILKSGVEIGAGSVIEDNVTISEGTCIRPNVTICSGTIIGQRVIIHPGVVIGADGFGIANDQGKWIKVPQLGVVVIGNDVEIGANTTIDRGAIDDTMIADGVKLDNQIQIGHNTIIGEHTVIAGCVGISGSTQIGKHCAIGGGTGIAGHIRIADGVQMTGMSMVTKSITESGSYSSGIPVEPTRQWHKSIVRYRNMDKLFERVNQLEKQKDES